MFALLLQEALRALWDAAFPQEELNDLVSEQWKEMGWQGKDPSTDFRCRNLFFFSYSIDSFKIYFQLHCISQVSLNSCGFSGRGGGYISLENLLYFARNFPVRPVYGCYLFSSMSLYLCMMLVCWTIQPPDNRTKEKIILNFVHLH